MPRTTRTPTTTAGSVALTVVLALTLVACQSDDPGASTTAIPTTEAPTSTPSPTETETTPEEEAIEEAEDAVRSYYDAVDASGQNPETFDREKFQDVAVGTALSGLESSFDALVAQELTQIGEVRLESIDDPKVDLTDNQDVSPPQVPNVEYTVCYDVSGLDVVDEEGASVVPAERANRGVARLGVANYEYPEGPWLVAFIEYLDETC